MTFLTSRRAVSTLIIALTSLLTPGAAAPSSEDPGITLPPGFKATVFADKITHARHLVVGPNGVVYVNTWSGRYYKDDKPPEGGFLVALKDSNGSGHADVIERFGETVATGGHGGTGIALYKDGLYAEINDRIVRYALPDGAVAPKGPPETVVSGLPLTGDHPMHPIAIDPKGNLFVDLGSATNACQSKNRMPEIPGASPCTEKETRGGIWRFDADAKDQTFSPAQRYASGLRNGEGLDFDADGRLFATQHGRDQLNESWSQFYTPEQGHNLPAEEMVEVKKGADYGWPECYYDETQQKLVLAPEYGGDGGKKVGVCAERQGPVAAFPAHWAPNAMIVYKGTQFPKAYRGGAFIAFHGSWNRAPGPQGGFNVVFQPLADGKSSGKWVVFADGFAGGHKEPGKALHRPTGLAVGPDGALYVSDDARGRIYRVTYAGDEAAPVEGAPPAPVKAATSGAEIPPEGLHPDAGKEAAGLPAPPGATKQEIALGGKIFRGEADGGTCGGCHGSDAAGGPIGPDLTSGKWLWSDGSLAGLTQTIQNGVANPKAHPGAMPPMGGVQLSPDHLKAVAAYVWAVGHQK